MLYHSTQIESAEWRAELSRDVLLVLARGYDLSILGSLPGRETVYVRTGFVDCEGNRYAVWSITDNGGEFVVAKVNSPELPRSIPYLGSRCGIVDAGTTAYRIAMAIRGDKIDWDFRMPEIVEALA